MKKLFSVIIITFIIFTLVGCDAQTKQPEETIDDNTIFQKADDDKKGVIVYYTKNGFLIPVTIKASDTDNMVTALDLLFKQRAPLGLKNELKDVELKGYGVDGDKIYVDVSGNFIKGNKVNTRIAQLTNTLFEDENINEVSIIVEGEPYQTITERPKYINLIERDSLSSNEDYLTIYYADTSKTYIVPVTIKSNKIHELRQKNETIETDKKAEVALLHIIEGPKNIDNLTGIFPDDIKLKKVWVEDSIAYVDIDIKLLLDLINERQYEKIAVESIVQTLTEIDGIEKIQFFINGKQWTSISGHVNISHPIERYELFNEIEPF